MLAPQIYIEPCEKQSTKSIIVPILNRSDYKIEAELVFDEPNAKQDDLYQEKLEKEIESAFSWSLYTENTGFEEVESFTIDAQGISFEIIFDFQE